MGFKAALQALQTYVRNVLGTEFDVLYLNLEPDGVWVGQVWEGERKVACVIMPFVGWATPQLEWVHLP